MIGDSVTAQQVHGGDYLATARAGGIIVEINRGDIGNNMDSDVILYLILCALFSTNFASSNFLSNNMSCL